MKVVLPDRVLDATSPKLMVQKKRRCSDRKCCGTGMDTAGRGVQKYKDQQGDGEDKEFRAEISRAVVSYPASDEDEANRISNFLSETRP